MHKRVFFLAFLFLVATAPGAVRAGQTQVYIGGVGFTGEHKEAAATIRDEATVALPVFAVRHRRGPLELSLEDIPPIGPVHFTNVTNGLESIKAGYGDGAVRYWTRNGHLGVGIGESLYWQRSSYASGGQLTTQYAVRSAGMRYEALGAFQFSRVRRVLLEFAASPSMHQRYGVWVSSPVNIPPVYGKASLVDGSIAIEERRGSSHSFAYGLRYVNYTGGSYPQLFDPTQERTGIVSAFAAWGFSL